MLSEIITSILEIFSIFALGIFARKIGYINKEDITRWSKLIIDMLFPFLVFSSIVSQQDAHSLRELWILPFIGFGFMAVGFAIGLVLLKFTNRWSRDIRKVFLFIMVVNNYGFLPLVMVRNLWGDYAISILFLLNIGSAVGFWTIGVAVLRGEDKQSFYSSIKNLATPMLITLVVTIILVATGLSRFVPESLVNISRSLGNAAVPSILLMIGATLYGVNFLKITKRVIYLVFCRNILIPLIYIAILKTLPLSEMAYNVCFVVAIMPASVTSIVMAQRYGGCKEYTSQAAIITTVVSIATIPLFMMFL